VAESIAREAGVDPILVRALIEASSGFNLRWEGIAGHRGLMGLRPDVMQAIGDRDFFHGHQNIRFGCAELKRVVALSGGDLRLTIVRYRVGPQATLANITPGSFLEEFVDKVVNIYEIAKARENTSQ
jgi:soluble lytic murein transglycosylase-like protein